MGAGISARNEIREQNTHTHTNLRENNALQYVHTRLQNEVPVYEALGYLFIGP